MVNDIRNVSPEIDQVSWRVATSSILLAKEEYGMIKWPFLGKPSSKKICLFFGKS